MLRTIGLSAQNRVRNQWQIVNFEFHIFFPRTILADAADASRAMKFLVELFEKRL